MKTIDEIKKIKDYYKDDLYKSTRNNQKEDLKYINDNFEVPEIREPHRAFRSGLGREVVDAPAEQIVTSNPQAFVDALKDTKGANEGASRLAREINQGWIPILKGQNPNPFKQSVKNPLGRGENYIHPVHSETWRTGTKYGLPVLFLIPDPMVIYGSPEEDDCGWKPNSGVPNQVVVFYERQPLDVIIRYPSWSNPKKAGLQDKKQQVEWFEYWDKDTRYFEADGEPVLKGENGIQSNIYGFTPFVRKRSGFGTTSYEGKLEELIVSDIRFIRDLLRAECIVWSNIISNMTLFAHRPRTIISPGEVNEDQIREQDFGSYSVAIYQNVPTGTEFKWEEVPAPTREMFQHHADIIARIQQRSPFIMAGFPMGSSGRQDVEAYTNAIKRYDTIIENTDTSWGTAFEMAFQIMKTIPRFPLPDGLHKSDLLVPANYSLKLKAKDPIADDRLSVAGRTMVQMGQLSLRSNLVKYQQMTEEEADDEIDQIFAEQYMFQSPDIAELMQVRAAEKSGMFEDIQALRQRRMELEKKIKQFPLGAQFGSQGGEPRTGNIQSPFGQEQAEYQRGQRVTPR